MSIDNHISVNEYNKITKYKEPVIKVEKIWHFKMTTVPLIMAKKAINRLKRYKAVTVSKISF